MKLVFQNVAGKKKTIANVDSEEQARAEISKFCADKNYEITNIRRWENKCVVRYDVGSWIEAFLLYLNE